MRYDDICSVLEGEPGLHTETQTTMLADRGVDVLTFSIGEVYLIHGVSWEMYNGEGPTPCPCQFTAGIFVAENAMHGRMCFAGHSMVRQLLDIRFTPTSLAFRAVHDKGDAWIDDVPIPFGHVEVEYRFTRQEGKMLWRGEFTANSYKFTPQEGRWQRKSAPNSQSGGCTAVVQLSPEGYFNPPRHNSSFASEESL